MLADNFFVNIAIVTLVVALVYQIWNFIKNRKKKIPYSHFSNIGFYLKGMEDIESFLAKSLEDGEKKQVGPNGGDYYKLSTPEGVEMWTYLNDNKIATFTPYFKSKNVNYVRIEEGVESRKTPWDGNFVARANPNDKDFPFVFASPDFFCRSSQQFPIDVPLQLTAFAERIAVYPDPDAYHKDKRGPRFPLGSFNSIGMADNESTPQPYAILTGTVEEAQVVKNSLTGKKFYWLAVKSYSVIIDVVVDKRLLKSLPNKGDVTKIAAWLAGYWKEERQEEVS